MVIRIGSKRVTQSLDNGLSLAGRWDGDRQLADFRQTNRGQIRSLLAFFNEEAPPQLVCVMRHELSIDTVIVQANPEYMVLMDANRQLILPDPSAAYFVAIPTLV